MEFGVDLLLILFAVAAFAGMVDSIAGGGGLITIPALLWAGITPAQALATNKLQGSFGSLTSSINFIRKGYVDPRDMVLAIVLTFAGSALGTVLVQMLDASILLKILPALLILIALYFLFSPRVGDIDAHQIISKSVFAFTAGFGIGFYDGFFGPGTGSFFSIAFVALLGFNMTKATAHTKVLNFTSNFASLVMFIAGGEVVWIIGAVMAVDRIAYGDEGRCTARTPASGCHLYRDFDQTDHRPVRQHHQPVLGSDAGLDRIRFYIAYLQHDKARRMVSGGLCIWFRNPSGAGCGFDKGLVPAINQVAPDCKH